MDKAIFYFRMTMAVVYTAIGVYILLNAGSLRGLIDDTYAPVIGGLVLAYGLYRGYNLYRLENNKDE